MVFRAKYDRINLCNRIDRSTNGVEGRGGLGIFGESANFPPNFISFFPGRKQFLFLLLLSLFVKKI